jgi:hypothetical protein
MTCFEQTQKCITNICTTLCACFIVLPSLAFCPLLCIGGFDLSGALDIALVSTNDYFKPCHIDAASLTHFILPMHERIERVSIVQIEDHQAATSICIKFLPNQLVVFVPRHIEKVDGNCLSFDLEFFDTVIDSNCLNVAFYELFLAIAFNQAAFSNFGISYTNNLESNLLGGRLARVCTRWLGG